MIAWLALAAWGDEVHRYSLLVARNDAGDERVALRYAHSDAQQMGEVLVELGGIAAERQRILYDPRPDELAAAFAALQAELAADPARTEVVFYYSGHSDEEGLLLGDDRYGYVELRAALEALPARVRVAILDSCASGALILSKGGRKVAPFLVDESVAVDGFAYITSSSADEVSQEAERVGGSYFTHFLETGLRGAADRSDDGRVTLTEAYTFAYDETLARTERTQHGPQHPTYQIELSGTGDLVLTDLSLTESSLVLDASIQGRALVRDEDGDLVAELYKPGGRPVAVALPAGSYDVRIVPVTDGSYAEAEVDLVAGADVVVDASWLDWHDGEDTVARGGGDVELEYPRLDLWRTEAPDGADTVVVAVGGLSRELEGVAVGLVKYDVKERARVLVTALGATSAGELSGVELSMGLNVVDDGGSGVQGTIGANVAGGGFDGVQGAVGFNWAGGGINGAQVSAGVNGAGKGFNGVQVTAGLNLSGAASEGLQLGSVNVAKGLDGVQLGALNVAQDVRGSQLGVMNVAGKVTTQVGIVNVADEAATPIGLLSFVKEGRHDLMIYASESDPLNLELRLGGRYFYNVLGGGGGGDQGYAAYGFGGHVPVLGDRVWTDADVVLANYFDARGGWLGVPTGVARGRFTVGAQPLPALGVYAGATANVRIPVDDLRLVDVAPDWIAPDDGTLLAWPGFYAGASLRF